MAARQLSSCVAVVALTVLFNACDRTTEYVQTVAPGPTTCAECHDPSNLITGKEAQWAESRHGTGTTYEAEGPNASCAGCHSGHAFAQRIKAGLDPTQVTQGDTDPTREDCRACHMIHETYTEKDFALRTTSPVKLFAVANATFNGGVGNLCVNCHQPRRDAPVAQNGMITGISSHWGPHHGPQSAMLLGVTGAGVANMPGGHYGAVENSCVTCHMGDGRDHHFEPAIATCQRCHPGEKNFDINGVQTEIVALSDQLGGLLLQAGLINENSPDGHPTVTEAPEDEGIALWNWLYVAHEDKSKGVHNPDYARALLNEGITRMGGTPVVAQATR